MRPRLPFPGSPITPEILAPTRLYRLEPFGLGTPQVEGLDSYLIRLSAAHCVSPRDLLRYELVPVEPRLRGTLWSSFPTRYAKTINGLGLYATGMASALNRLTGRNDLESLSLLPWDSLFTSNGAGLMASSKRWCAACLAERHLEGRQAYRPLAWTFDLLTACPLHGLPLVSTCPKCKKTQSHVPSIPVIDQCEHCQAYLGMTLVSSATSADQLRVAEELLGLLERKPKDPLANLRRNLKRLMERESIDSRDVFARRHGLNKELLKNWFNKSGKPALPQLIETSLRVGVRTVDLVSNSLPLDDLQPHVIDPLKARAPRIPLSANARRKRSILEKLAKQAIPPSLVDASKTIGLTPSAVRYRYPTESSLLIAMRTQYLLRSRQQKEQAIDAAILSAMKSITEASRTLSRRRVEAQLRQQDLSLWQPRVRARYLALRGQRQPIWPADAEAS